MRRSVQQSQLQAYVQVARVPELAGAEGRLVGTNNTVVEDGNVGESCHSRAAQALPP